MQFIGFIDVLYMFIVRAMHMSAYGQMDVSEFQSPFDAS